MTAALYARRKSWPLESVTVSLRHNRIHAVDCANCETQVGMIDRIDVSIELAGSLTKEQRSRLHEIAERCPVRRTLESENEIRSRLA
jgi:putative redox protein